MADLKFKITGTLDRAATKASVDAALQGMKFSIAKDSIVLGLDRAGTQAKIESQLAGMTFKNNKPVNLMGAVDDKSISKNLKQMDSMNSAMKKQNAASKEAIRFTNQQRIAYRELANFEKKSPQYARTNQGYINNIRGSVINATDVKQVEQARHGFAKLQNQMLMTGDSGIGVFDRLFQTVSKFGSWYLLGGAVVGFVNVFKNSVATVRELDNVMTDLKKVTDETESSYSKFMQSANVTAQNIGTTTKDMVSSTADFARLGYTFQEAQKLAESANIYANVGDMGIDDSTEALISIMKGFNIEASDSVSVIDKLNEVGNKFAISSQGLGQGLQRSASALALAGNDIDESIGLITAANTVIQNPEEAGNSVKILSMRLRGMKGELESLGEEAEGVESISKIQTQILNLSKGKVNIFKDDGTYKSTYDIMVDIAKVWEDISQTDQASLLEIIAGKQRGNTIASIIKSMKDLEGAKQASIDSDGSALAENEKYMNSISGHIEKTQAKFERMAMSIADSDMIKFVVDLGGGIADLITPLGKIATNVPALAALATGLALLKKSTGGMSLFTGGKGGLSFLGIDAKTLSKDLASVKNSTNKLNDIKAAFGMGGGAGKSSSINIKEIKSAKGELQSFNIVNKATGMSVSKTGVVTKAAGVGLKSFSVGVKSSTTAMKLAAAASKGLAVSLNLIAGIGFMLAMTAITTAISKVTSHSKEAKEKLTELSEAYKNAQSEGNSNIDTIKGLSSEFNTLSQGVSDNGKNIGLSATEYGRYKEIVAEIVSLNPALVQGYNAEGEAIINKNKLIEESIELQEKEMKAAESEYLSSKKDIFKGWETNRKDIFKSDEFKAESSPNLTRPGMSASVVSDIKNQELSYNSLSKTIIALKEERNSLAATGLSANASEIAALEEQIQNYEIIKDKVSVANESMKEYATTYISSMQSLNSDAIKNNKDLFSQGLDDLIGNSSWKNITEAENAIKDYSRSFTKSMESLENPLKRMDKAKREYFDSDRTETDRKAYISALEKEKTTFDSLGNTYSELQPILRDLYSTYEDFPDLDPTEFLRESLNTLANDIDSARNAKKKFDTAMEGGDYYTTAEQFSSIFETILDGKNNLGKGSLSFWQGAKQILGDEYLEKVNYDFDRVNGKLKEFQSASKSGINSTEKLFSMLAKKADGSGKIIDEFGNKIATVIEGKDGSISFDIKDENLDAVAAQLGVSREYLVGMVDAARQFSNTNFHNFEDALKAIRQFNEEQGALLGDSGDQFMLSSKLQEFSGLQGAEWADFSDKVQKNGVELISTADSADVLIKKLGNLDAALITTKDGVSSIDVDSFLETMYTMGATSSDASNMLQKLSSHGGIALDVELGNKDAITYIDDKFAEWDSEGEIEIDPEVANTEAITDLTSAIDDLTIAMGGVPSSIDIETNADFTSIKKSVESFASLDKAGQNEVKLNIQSNIDEEKAKIEQLKKAAKNLTGEDKAKLELKIEADEAKLYYYEKKFLEFQGYDNKEIIAKIGAEPKGFDKVNKDLKTVKKGRDTASGIVDVRAISTGFHDVMSKIKDLKLMKKVYTVTTNFINRVFEKKEKKAAGTSNKHIGELNSGLALTGELGYEVVWSPSKGHAYITGSKGAEFAYLNKGDVVFTHEQSKKMLSGSNKKQTFPSFASGTYTPGSYDSKGNKTTTKTTTKTTAKSSSTKSSTLGSKTSLKNVKKKKKKTAKEIAEARIKDYERAKKRIDHLLAMGYISEKTYYSRLKKIYKRHLKGYKGVTDAKRQSLEDQRQARLNLYEKEKADLERQLERNQISYSKYWSKLKSLRNKYLKKKGYAAERAEADKEIADAAVQAYDKEKEALDKRLAQGKISIEKYNSSINAIIKKYLKSNKYNLDEAAIAAEDRLVATTEAIKREISDLDQWISDRDLFKDWTPGENKVTALIAGRAKLIKQYQNGLIAWSDFQEELMDYERKIAEAEQERYEDNKQYLDDIINLTKDMVRQEMEDHIKALEKQLSAYKKLIDKKKESLALTKQELSYQEEVDDKVSEIAKLQAKRDALAFDDSRSAQAKRKDIDDEIARLQKDLHVYQRDYALDNQTEALDKQADKLDELIQKDIEGIEDILNHAGKMLELTLDRIANSDQDQLLKDLLNYNKEHGDGMDHTVNKMWADSQTIFGGIGRTANDILAYLENKGNKYSGGGSASSGADSTNYKSQKDVDKLMASSYTAKQTDATNLSNATDIFKYYQDAYYDKVGNKWYKTYADYEAAKKAEKKAANKAKFEALAKKYNATSNKTKKASYLADIKKIPGYSKVTVSGKKFYKPNSKGEKVRIYHRGLEEGFVGGISDLRQDETAAILKHGELVLTKEQQITLLKNLGGSNSLKDTYMNKHIGVTSGGNNPINIHVETPVNIAGDVNKKSLEDIERVINIASIKATDRLNDALKVRGYTGKISKKY